MTNPAKRKGSAFEATVRDYLRSCGLPLERIPAGMKDDRGDLAGLPDWTLELKAYTDTTRALRDGFADLEREQANADTPFGAVITKRRGVTDPGRQLVHMELWQFAALLARPAERVA